jgi:hypothetical protein
MLSKEKLAVTEVGRVWIVLAVDANLDEVPLRAVLSQMAASAALDQSYSSAESSRTGGHCPEDLGLGCSAMWPPGDIAKEASLRVP